jgi:epsilon-lactone hydrolase
VTCDNGLTAVRSGYMFSRGGYCQGRVALSQKKPSMRGRLAAFFARFISIFFSRSFYPLGYQRFWLSKLPGYAPKPRGTRCEPVTITGAGCEVPIPAEWVIPTGVDEDRVILYLHGGAFVVGSIESHRNMAARLAREAGGKALVIDYRLAPEHPYPAGPRDCLAAYSWLLDQGYSPVRMAIAGDSAGGGLTASTLLAIRDSGRPLPAAGVMLSPALDLTMSAKSIWTRRWEDPVINVPWAAECIQTYLGGTDPREPEVSPMFADLSGLPPMMIHVGSREVLLDDSISFAERAAEAGAEVDLEVWEGMFHVFQFCAPVVPESRESFEKMGAFCRSRMS